MDVIFEKLNAITLKNSQSYFYTLTKEPPWINILQQSFCLKTQAETCFIIIRNISLSNF